MRRIRKAKRQEPTIALINIVFLILIFFMVAGTVTSTPDSQIQPVQTKSLECCVPRNALMIKSDQSLSLQGKALASLDEYMSKLEAGDMTVRILPDKNLPAHDLLEIISKLRAKGGKPILILTENSST